MLAKIKQIIITLQKWQLRKKTFHEKRDDPGWYKLPM